MSLIMIVKKRLIKGKIKLIAKRCKLGFGNKYGLWSFPFEYERQSRIASLLMCIMFLFFKDVKYKRTLRLTWKHPLSIFSILKSKKSTPFSSSVINSRKTLNSKINKIEKNEIKLNVFFSRIYILMTFKCAIFQKHAAPASLSFFFLLILEILLFSFTFPVFEFKDISRDGIFPHDSTARHVFLFMTKMSVERYLVVWINFY